MLGMTHNIKVKDYQNENNAFKKAIALEPERIRLQNEIGW